MRKILAKWQVGSYLYGLNTSESDKDYMSVFMPKAEDLLGLKQIEEINNSTKSSSTKARNSKDDIDDKSYSLKKFVNLLIKNNPNIIEVLFANKESTLTMTPIFQELIDNKDRIVSKKIYYTFTGYAYSQRKKLIIKKQRFDHLNESIKFIEENFNSKINNYKINEEEASLLNKKLKYYKSLKNNTNSFHKGIDLSTIMSHLIDERDTYGWRVKTSSFKKVGYDVKFAYHILRIIAEGIELLKNRELKYPIKGKIRDDIIRVRECKVEYSELLSIYDEYKKQCDLAYEETKLIEKPDWEWINNWLIKTLKENIKNE